MGEKHFAWRALALPVVAASRAAFRIRAEGLERLPRTGAALLASNHVSVLDPVILGVVVSGQGRTIRFVAASELFEHPLWGRSLRAIRQVPVRRGAGDLAATEALAGVLRDGGVAGIFPEGGVRDGAPPLRGHSGAVRIAVSGRAPVLPIGIWGSQARWPRGRPRVRPVRRLPLGDSVGQPLDLQHVEPSPKARREATEHLMRVIEEQVGRARALTER